MDVDRMRREADVDEEEKRKGRRPISLSVNESIEIYRGEEVGEGDRELYRSSRLN